MSWLSNILEVLKFRIESMTQYLNTVIEQTKKELGLHDDDDDDNDKFAI